MVLGQKKAVSEEELASLHDRRIFNVGDVFQDQSLHALQTRIFDAASRMSDKLAEADSSTKPPNREDRR